MQVNLTERSINPGTESMGRADDSTMRTMLHVDNKRISTKGWKRKARQQGFQGSREDKAQLSNEKQSKKKKSGGGIEPFKLLGFHKKRESDSCYR